MCKQILFSSYIAIRSQYTRDRAIPQNSYEKQRLCDGIFTVLEFFLIVNSLESQKILRLAFEIGQTISNPKTNI